MVLTTLSLCLQPAKNNPTTKWTILRALSLGLVMITLPALTGCGSGGGSEAGPINSTAPSSGGGGSGGGPAGTLSASLAWDPVSDQSVIGYFVHYGTQSSHSPGSCAYAKSTYSTSPAATVTGLAPNTAYFFAVSAYNGLESACSSEVSTVTSAT
jgi:Fibronectin type III domain